jgi:hypothetical protein
MRWEVDSSSSELEPEVGSYEHINEPLRPINRQGISWLAERL